MKKELIFLVLLAEVASSQLAQAGGLEVAQMSSCDFAVRGAENPNLDSERFRRSAEPVWLGFQRQQLRNWLRPTEQVYPGRPQGLWGQPSKNILTRERLSEMAPGSYSFVVPSEPVSGVERPIIIGESEHFLVKHINLGYKNGYSAGEITIQNVGGRNEVTAIIMKSNTFMPKFHTAFVAVESLWAAGIYPGNLSIKSYLDDEQGTVTIALHGDRMRLDRARLNYITQMDSKDL